ncbi:MAG: hypothetical protein Q4D16_03690 [Eubacteriales bacterium]|nr:hypothetical protein [Eubacteriales bacterium]
MKSEMGARKVVERAGEGKPVRGLSFSSPSSTFSPHWSVILFTGRLSRLGE